MKTYQEYSREELAPAGIIEKEMFYSFIAWVDRSDNTARSYIINLRQFMAWLRFTATDRPTRADIIAFRKWLIEKHDAIQYAPETPQGWKYRTDPKGAPVKITCKPNTTAQYLRSVTQFFKWAAANGLYPDIAANIHAPKVSRAHRKDALSRGDVLAIENSIIERATDKEAAASKAEKDQAGRQQRSGEQGKRLLAIYLLAVNLGLRTIEISRANVKDLETKGGQSWLYVWGKGRTEADQKKPLAPEIADVIKDYLRSRTDRPTGASPLFVSTGNRSGGKRIAATTISTMLKRAMQAAGFDSERLTAHSLRHTAATNLLKTNDNNIYLTQIYMRHANPATTELYLHTDTDAQQAEMAKSLYCYYHSAKAAE